jgi:hypothetical protein
MFVGAFQVSPKGGAVTNDTCLIPQAAEILDRLFSLPCRQELSVQTRRYPRLLPAESGVGFQQTVWSFNEDHNSENVSNAIPADAEEVVFTWKSGIGTEEYTDQISEMVGVAFSELTLKSGWEYEVFLRHTEQDNRRVIVRIFQNYAACPG